MDRLIALQVFHRVAERGSFAEAGRSLGLSPAAISKNIAELEAHVGTRLIHRTTRRMALTEEGRLYLEHVTRALDALADADRALCPIKAAPSGLLKVSAPMTFTLTQISSAIPGFLERYPELQLDLHLDDRRVDIVREGFDLAIRGSDRLEDSSLIARPLMAMSHVLCAAPGYFEKHGRPARQPISRAWTLYASAFRAIRMSGNSSKMGTWNGLPSTPAIRCLPAWRCAMRCARALASA